MSLRGRVVSWFLKHEIERIRGRYEAAYWNTARSYLPGFIQSAREDISALARQEILRRVRYFEKNSGVMQKTLQVLDTNTIGTGITPVPSSSSEDFNAKAIAWWNDWVATADMSCTSSLYEIQSQAFRAQNVDGDCFIRLTKTQSGRPAIDLIEAHRVGTGSVNGGDIERSGGKLVDGVVVDKKWRYPRAYMIADDFNTNAIETVPASDIVHFFKKERSGQYRGLTKFHAAILDLHDLDDLQKFEMQAAKDAASITKLIRTAAGSMPADGNGVGASVIAQINTDVLNSRPAYYAQSVGPETKILLPGDEYDQYASKRPTAATSGYWDRLERKIVQGSDMSYAALTDYAGNWNGAALRAAFQSDQRIFRLSTAHQSRKWQKVWEYGIGWAMLAGELPKCADFRKVRWHPPRRGSVDIGNESQAMLDELKGALRTYDSIYGELGDDWRERLEQRTIEEAFLDMLSKKYNVPVARIASFAQERLAGQAPDAVAPQPGQSPQGNGQPTKGGNTK